jgi:hypothetical protein
MTSCVLPAPDDPNVVFLDFAMAPLDHLKTGLRELALCLLVAVPFASDSMTSCEGIRCMGLSCLRRAIWGM